VIGDLAFGAPFGMLEKGQDFAEVTQLNGKTTHAPAIEVLNRRGEVSGTIGCYPWIKPYAKYFPDPFFSQGMKAIQDLAGIAIARVNARLEKPSDRVDLLARLMEGRDETGQKLGKEELTAEALRSSRNSNKNSTTLSLTSMPCPPSRPSKTCPTSTLSSKRQCESTAPPPSACRV
jgi:benzoate 4-monooxygenase